MGRVPVWVCLLVYLYPVWLCGSFYLVWLIAWVQLGHSPRPMLDDPKEVGGFTSVVQVLPGLLLMGMPVLVPLGFAASCLVRIPIGAGWRFPLRVMLALLYVASTLLCLWLIRADPLRVVEWWFD